VLQRCTVRSSKLAEQRIDTQCQQGLVILIDKSDSTQYSIDRYVQTAGGRRFSIHSTQVRHEKVPVLFPRQPNYHQ